jgi:hypothetical protein
MKHNTFVRLPCARIRREERNRIKAFAAAQGLPVEELIRRALRYYLRDRRAATRADAPHTPAEWECAFWLMRLVRSSSKRNHLKEVLQLLLAAERD